MIFAQDVAPADVTRTLQQILDRPEFAVPPVPPLLQWYQSVRDAIRDALLRALEWVFGRLGAGVEGAVGDVILWALIIASLVALAFVLVSSLEGLRTGGGRRSTPDTAGPDLQLPGSSIAALEKLAREALAAGRIEEAAHALYGALILRLQDRGVVVADAAKTPGEYRREARRRDAEAGSLLTGFFRDFEPIVFGGREPVPESVTSMVEAARRGGVLV